jgi:hypothetical protein
MAAMQKLIRTKFKAFGLTLTGFDTIRCLVSESLRVIHDVLNTMCYKMRCCFAQDHVPIRSSLFDNLVADIWQ